MNHAEIFNNTPKQDIPETNRMFFVSEFVDFIEKKTGTKVSEFSDNDVEFVSNLFSNSVAGTYTEYEVPDLKKRLSDKITRDYAREDLIGHKLRTFSQTEGLLDGVQNGLYIIGGASNIGKALWDNELIPTPDGYVKNGDLKVGDFVIGSDGKPTKVLDVFPQNKRPLYKVTMSDGSITFADLEHRWYTYTNKNRKGEKTGSIKTTKEIVATLHRNNGAKRHAIKRIAPVQYAKKELKMHPYLLGMFLGDGCYSGNFFGFASLDKEMVDDFNMLLKKHKGVLKKRKGDNCDYFVSGIQDFRRVLDSYGLKNKKSFEKFIPSDYLMSTIDDRLEMLRGLFDTDGSYVESSRVTEYSTTSEKLKDNVIQIARSLGARASFSQRMGGYKLADGSYKETRINYRVYVKFSSDINPFKLKRKAEKVKPAKKGEYNYIKSIEYAFDDYATCISVDSKDHLYATKDFILTHNTQISLNVFVDAMISNKKLYQIIYSLDDNFDIMINRIVAILSQGNLTINQIQKPRHLSDVANIEFEIKADDGVNAETRIEMMSLRGIYTYATNKLQEWLNDRLLIFDIETIVSYDILRYHLEKTIESYKSKDVMVLIDGVFNLDVGHMDLRLQNILRANLVKNLVDTYNIPLFVTVELRKKSSHDGRYKEPTLDDIMETGKFAYNANLVWLLCFNSDIGIDAEKVAVKTKYAKNKLSGYKGAMYTEFIRDRGIITEGKDQRLTREMYEDQSGIAVKKNDENSNFLKNQPGEVVKR